VGPAEFFWKDISAREWKEEKLVEGGDKEEFNGKGRNIRTQPEMVKY
jgi:hypothetical protein